MTEESIVMNVIGGVMSILYSYGHSWYINMTNRCPCKCVFCVRNNVRALGDADDLWLIREPTVDEVLSEVHSRASDASEIVFCGYGEPTERLADLLEISGRIRSELGIPIRLNTNGLGNLINGRDIVPELVNAIDSISISLNASNAEEYERVSRPRFGSCAYDHLMDFIRDSAKLIPDVTLSIVGGTIPLSSEEECRRIADSLGVSFRIRRCPGTIFHYRIV